MEINRVGGDRIFLVDLQPYKEEKHKDLELIQYTGTVMQATIKYLGTDCKHHEVGEVVIFQEPIGIALDFEGVRYRVVREPDLLFSTKEA